MSEEREPKSFDKYKAKAKRLLDDESKVKSLIDVAGDKITAIMSNSAKMSEFADKVRLAIRMVQAYISGEYRELPWRTLIILVAGILYFVTPLDLIPDFIPALGFVDDISVIFWIFRSFADDLEKYQEWEASLVYPQ
ncbi:MAG: YkvA family protein [Cyclobacteriaceae bacterium]